MDTHISKRLIVDSRVDTKDFPNTKPKLPRNISRVMFTWTFTVTASNCQNTFCLSSRILQHLSVKSQILDDHHVENAIDAFSGLSDLIKKMIDGTEMVSSGGGGVKRSGEGWGESISVHKERCP